MSLIGQREAIAAALTTVADVTGHAKRPVPPAEGDAWPVLGPGDRQSGTAFILTWAVRVIVPQDEYAAEDWWDAHWPALFYALEDNVATVGRFEPITLTTSAGDVLAYQITITTGE